MKIWFNFNEVITQAVRLTVLAFLFFSAEDALGQKEDSTYVHKQIVKEFYKLLFQKSVTIGESAKVFGEEAFLWEEHFYEENCPSKDSVECDSFILAAVENPTTSTSLLFAKLSSLRDSLTLNAQSGSIEKAIRGMKFRNKNVAEISVSGRVIIFMFSGDPEIYPFYITVIFLPSGASVFNYVDGNSAYYR